MSQRRLQAEFLDHFPVFWKEPVQQAVVLDGLLDVDRGALPGGQIRHRPLGRDLDTGAVGHLEIQVVDLQGIDVAGNSGPEVKAPQGRDILPENPQEIGQFLFFHLEVELESPAFEGVVDGACQAGPQIGDREGQVDGEGVGAVVERQVAAHAAGDLEGSGVEVTVAPEKKRALVVDIVEGQAAQNDFFGRIVPGVFDAEHKIGQGRTFHHRGDESQRPARSGAGQVRVAASRAVGEPQAGDFQVPDPQDAAQERDQIDADMHPADGLETGRIAPGPRDEAEIRRREAKGPGPFDLKISIHNHPDIAHLRGGPDRQGPIIVVVHRGDGDQAQDQTQGQQQAEGGEEIFKDAKARGAFQRLGPAGRVSAG